MTSPIIITGGAQRLGLALAESLINDGHSVIITYRSEKPSVKALRDLGAVALHADFSDDAGIKSFIHTLLSDATLNLKSNKIRAIIHNASDWDQEADADDYGTLLNKMMQVHASAPYQINLAIKDLLHVESGFADVIHMTDYVQEKGSKKHIAYAASKAALHNLTLSFSAALAPTVKVNSIAPALVMFNEWDSDEYKAKSLKKSLLETCPGAQEAVRAVRYLLDSEYITGQSLNLNGGRHLK